MATLDIFNNDVFSFTSMSSSINLIPFTPMQVGGLGIFNDLPVRTTTIWVEERQGRLALIQSSPRGGPGMPMGLNRRVARNFQIPHLQIDDSVMADEIQNIRDFGSEDQVRSIEGLVAEKQAAHVESIETTIEFQRMGAIQGTVRDADLTVMVDLFTEFGITRVDGFAFDFANATVPAVLQMIDDIHLSIRTQMGGTMFNGYHAFCGHQFISELRTHDAYRSTVQRFEDGVLLNETFMQNPGNRGVQRIVFQNTIFEEYQGTVSGVDFVAPTDAHFFPLSPIIFNTYFGPAEYEETVNTLGLPRYARQWPMENSKGRFMEVQSNPLSLCLRPATLVHASSTNTPPPNGRTGP